MTTPARLVAVDEIGRHVWESQKYLSSHKSRRYLIFSGIFQNLLTTGNFSPFRIIKNHRKKSSPVNIMIILLGKDYA